MATKVIGGFAITWQGFHEHLVFHKYEKAVDYVWAKQIENYNGDEEALRADYPDECEEYDRANGSFFGFSDGWAIDECEIII